MQPIILKLEFSVVEFPEGHHTLDRPDKTSTRFVVSVSRRFCVQLKPTPTQHDTDGFCLSTLFGRFSNVFEKTPMRHRHCEIVLVSYRSGIMESMPWKVRQREQTEQEELQGAAAGSTDGKEKRVAGSTDGKEKCAAGSTDGKEKPQVEEGCESKMAAYTPLPLQYDDITSFFTL
ncbi:hypothetical protein EOD39_8529 [Acipenser ruthenus]|uniref:Uncharacterized protein n=1 Tax=Acipenser ruthenus TaxID=7906 RepID=A0A444U3Q7_ACIRT|nr:hypothetical protein EOD39_8529 [Acipenser ruthenus]